jgi:hypothetical protein
MKLIFDIVKFALLLNIPSYSAAFDPQSDFSSAILRGNKVYAFSNKYYDDGKPKFSVYTINTQDVQTIINNSTVLSLTNLPDTYLPGLLDFQIKDSNELFFMGGQKYTSLKTSSIDNTPLLSTYDLGSINMTYHNEGVMKQPTFDKFPQYYYSTTPVTVSQKDGSTQTVIYIFGGYIYSEKLKKPALTNLFYSYNVNTKEWKDLNDSVDKDDVPPLGGHTAVLVENRYIYMLGGLTWPKGNYTDQVANSASGPPATSLSKILFYDTQDNTWTKKTVSALVYNDLLDKPLFGFTGNYYDNNIVVFGGFVNNNSAPDSGASYNILYSKYNVKTGQWNFTSIARNSDKTVQYPIIGCGGSVVYNNQLILVDGTRAPKGDFRERLYVIDLNSDKIVNTLQLAPEKPKDPPPSDPSSDDKGSSPFPVYGIVLIVLAIVAILAIIAFIYYRKRKARKSKGLSINTNTPKNITPIQEVWSDKINSKSPTSPTNNIYNIQTEHKYQQGQHSTTGTGNSDTKVMHDLPHFQHEQEVNFSLENDTNLGPDYGRN